MRHFESKLTPPKAGQSTPWHPETLLDIRGLNTFDLPRLGDEEYGDWIPFAGINSGGESVIKAEMERFFLQTPAIGFMADEDGNIHVFEFIPQEVSK